MTEKNSIHILSFDIGSVNFSCTKSRVNLAAVKSLKTVNVPLRKRYDNNGECLPAFAMLMRKLSTLSTLVFADKINLTQKGDKRCGKRLVITNRVLVRLTNYLEDLNQQGIYDDVDYFVIEEQVQAKTAANNRELQFHLRSYLLMLFLNFRPIILFPSKNKTQVLGAPKMVHDTKKDKMIKMNYTARKHWACERAFQILSDREDFKNLELIFEKKGKGKKKKPDDICDCIVMTESFLFLLFVDEKMEILDC